MTMAGRTCRRLAIATRTKLGLAGLVARLEVVLYTVHGRTCRRLAIATRTKLGLAGLVARLEVVLYTVHTNSLRVAEPRDRAADHAWRTMSTSHRTLHRSTTAAHMQIVKIHGQVWRARPATHSPRGLFQDQASR